MHGYRAACTAVQMLSGFLLTKCMQIVALMSEDSAHVMANNEAETPHHLLRCCWLQLLGVCH